MMSSLRSLFQEVAFMETDARRTVVLENGETLSGVVISVNDARFLVQTDEVCLRLSEQQIRSVDDEGDIRRVVEIPEGEIHEGSYFHEVREDGGGTDLIWTREIHTGLGVKTRQTFVFGRCDRALTGAERRDLGQVVASMEYRDRWGETLPVAVEETEMGWTLRVRLRMPVFPGEPFELVQKKVWPRWSRQEGDAWVRSHFVRPQIDTLTTVVIQLPEGAAFSDVTPEPLWQLDVNGRETAGWRRYITAGEAFMPVVTYRIL